MKQSPGKADVTTQYIVELHHCFLNTGIISVFSTSRVIQTFSSIDICRLRNIHENLRSIIFAYTHVCILKQFEYFNIHIDHLNVMNK